MSLRACVTQPCSYSLGVLGHRSQSAWLKSRPLFIPLQQFSPDSPWLIPNSRMCAPSHLCVPAWKPGQSTALCIQILSLQVTLSAHPCPGGLGLQALIPGASMPSWCPCSSGSLHWPPVKSAHSLWQSCVFSCIYHLPCPIALLLFASLL